MRNISKCIQRKGKICTQNPALLVVQEGAGYAGFNDRKVDLRVDEHPKSIAELQRIYTIYDEFAAFWRKDEE